MQIEVFPNADMVAQVAAARVAAAARGAVAQRGKFALAVSGGQTPWQMLRCLASENVPWKEVHIFQVDERIAPAGHADRNLTQLQDCLSGVSLPAENLHAMPVEETDLESAATRYADTIRATTGREAIFDLVHLGLGADGHTASLIPGDAVLEVADRDVALCGVYQGRRRMTLTYPIINRARAILWLATGAAKQEMLARLRAGDASIPAGRVSTEQATILADAAAVGER